MTVSQAIATQEHVFIHSKFLRELKNKLLIRSDKEYSSELFNICYDEAKRSALCENDINKGEIVFNNSIYCKKCYEKLTN